MTSTSNDIQQELGDFTKLSPSDLPDETVEATENHFLAALDPVRNAPPPELVSDVPGHASITLETDAFGGTWRATATTCETAKPDESHATPFSKYALTVELDYDPPQPDAETATLSTFHIHPANDPRQELRSALTGVIPVDLTTSPWWVSYGKRFPEVIRDFQESPEAARFPFMVRGSIVDEEHCFKVLHRDDRSAIVCYHRGPDSEWREESRGTYSLASSPTTSMVHRALLEAANHVLVARLPAVEWRAV